MPSAPPSTTRHPHAHPHPHTPQAAEMVSPPPPAPRDGDATGGVIPYKNVPALVGYYVGIFSFVGLFLFILPGVLMGLAAMILGAIGLRKKRREPHVKGSAHAITALACGALSTLLGSGILIAIGYAMYTDLQTP